jgi:hypothetical protein
MERHLIGSHVANGVHDLVTNSSIVKLVGSSTSDSTFTYQKGLKNTSSVYLLFCKGVVDNHFFHKVLHSFLKMVFNERNFITIRVAIVDNTKSIIQVGGHTPRVIFLDTCAQLMILGVQFTKMMGMFNAKLWKSMWQIRTASGSIKEVLGESSYLITFNFNESTD